MMDNILTISVHVGRGVFQEVEGDELESGCTDSLVREARAEGSTEPMNGPLDADFEKDNNG